MKTLRVPLTLALSLLLAAAFTLDADAQRKKTQPDVSQEASVSQTLGIDEKVAITYHRPGVKGRDVWTGKSDNERIGQLVPRDGDPRPWRAGANECTLIEFSADVKVEGKDLPAGTYSLSMIPTDGGWIVIFNKNVRGWGTFMYKQDDDALRVTVNPVEAPHQEWLIYGFEELETNSATAYLHWEKKKVQFKIELAKTE